MAPTLNKEKLLSFILYDYKPVEAGNLRIEEEALDDSAAARIYQMDTHLEVNGDVFEFYGDAVVNLSVCLVVLERLKEIGELPANKAAKVKLENVTLALCSNKALGMLSWRYGYGESITVNPIDKQGLRDFLESPGLSPPKKLADHLEARFGTIDQQAGFDRALELIKGMMMSLVEPTLLDYGREPIEEHEARAKEVEMMWYTVPDDVQGYVFTTLLHRLNTLQLKAFRDPNPFIKVCAIGFAAMKEHPRMKIKVDGELEPSVALYVPVIRRLMRYVASRSILRRTPQLLEAKENGAKYMSILSKLVTSRPLLELVGKHISILSQFKWVGNGEPSESVYVNAMYAMGVSLWLGDSKQCWKWVDNLMNILIVPTDTIILSSAPEMWPKYSCEDAKPAIHVPLLG